VPDSSSFAFSGFGVLLSASLTNLDFEVLDLDGIWDGAGGFSVCCVSEVERLAFLVASVLAVFSLVEERVTRRFGSGASEGSTDLRRLGVIWSL
jgi:hypothetical protein